MPSFSLEEIWKRKFSSGQTLANDANLANSGRKFPVKRVEQNLWTEVSRKALIQPILGMLPTHKKERNMNI